MNKFIKKYGWNWFELGLIGIVSIIGLYFFAGAVTPAAFIIPVIDLIAAICGIFSVVLCAKGKKTGFIFGLINLIGYAIIAFNNLYFGEVLLNVLFYIPVNIISYITWKKNQYNDKNEVIPKRLNWKQITIGLIVIVLLTLGLHFFLAAIGGAMTLLDGTTTILSIAASLLMWRRYAEQWACWIVVDAITVVMWIIAGDPIMIVMWGAYLINAFYGYYLWLKKSGGLPWQKKKQLCS